MKVKTISQAVKDARDSDEMKCCLCERHSKCMTGASAAWTMAPTAVFVAEIKQKTVQATAEAAEACRERQGRREEAEEDAAW